MADVITGQKTKTTNGEVSTINVLRSVSETVNGLETIIYTNVGGRGKPTQEFSMSRTVYDSEGWA